MVKTMMSSQYHGIPIRWTFEVKANIRWASSHISLIMLHGWQQGSAIPVFDLQHEMILRVVDSDGFLAYLSASAEQFRLACSFGYYLDLAIFDISVAVNLVSQLGRKR